MMTISACPRENKGRKWTQKIFARETKESFKTTKLEKNQKSLLSLLGLLSSKDYA